MTSACLKEDDAHLRHAKAIRDVENFHEEELDSLWSGKAGGRIEWDGVERDLEHPPADEERHHASERAPREVEPQKRPQVRERVDFHLFTVFTEARKDLES